MDVFDLHSQIVEDYKSYVSSFFRIEPADIREVVERALDDGHLWPEPLLQLNPAFEDAGPMSDLAEQGLMHPACHDIFNGYRLYRHQREAIERGLKKQNFVVTSGTGSGKSLNDLFESEKVTVSAGVPTVWQGLLAYMDANKLVPKGVKVGAEDIREGLVALLSVWSSSPRCCS